MATGSREADIEAGIPSRVGRHVGEAQERFSLAESGRIEGVAGKELDAESRVRRAVERAANGCRAASGRCGREDREVLVQVGPGGVEIEGVVGIDGWSGVLDVAV